VKVTKVVTEDFFGNVQEVSLDRANGLSVTIGDGLVTFDLKDGVLTVRQNVPALRMDSRTLKAYARKRFGKLSVEL
jgi:hypothetical protein